MSNNEGTAMVLQACASRDMFSAAEIVEATGLDRQLVFYHLKKFVSSGYLEKVGTVYRVADRPRLVEAIVLGKREKRVTKMEATLIVNKGNVDALNVEVEMLLLARALDLPYSREWKDALNRELDKTIEGLKAAKRSLNTGTISMRKARKKINAEYNVVNFVKHMEQFGVLVDVEQYRTHYERLTEIM